MLPSRCAEEYPLTTVYKIDADVLWNVCVKNIFDCFLLRSLSKKRENGRKQSKFFSLIREISVSHGYFEKFGVLPMTFVRTHQHLSGFGWCCSFLLLRLWQTYIAEYP